MFNFGRRVVFDRQVTSKKLLETHLTQVHDLSQSAKAYKDSLKEQEREYIDKRKLQDELREAEKQFYHS